MIEALVLYQAVGVLSRFVDGCFVATVYITEAGIQCVVTDIIYKNNC